MTSIFCHKLEKMTDLGFESDAGLEFADVNKVSGEIADKHNDSVTEDFS